MGKTCGGIFDVDSKIERLEEVNLELENPDIWNDPERATKISKEKAQLDGVIDTITGLETTLADADAMLELAVEAEDESLLKDVQSELDKADTKVADLEFKRMFNGEMDGNDCYLDIQSGSGGTEAQDWAEMLLRMYTRWCESHGFKADVIEVSAGSVAGIKSATIHVKGDYAFGWLRTETGVHRLVRKSPFDSNNGRHTSFASVFIRLKSTMTLILILTLPICVLTPIAQAGQGVSTLTRPILRCELPTFQREPYQRVKMNAVNTPTKTPP